MLRRVCVCPPRTPHGLRPMLPPDPADPGTPPGAAQTGPPLRVCQVASVLLRLFSGVKTESFFPEDRSQRAPPSPRRPSAVLEQDCGFPRQPRGQSPVPSGPRSPASAPPSVPFSGAWPSLCFRRQQESEEKERKERSSGAVVLSKSKMLP